MPKVAGWPPALLTKVPAADLKRGDGDQLVEFASVACRITKDSVAGQTGDLMVMRPWQGMLHRHVLARRADGRRRHRTALVGMGRKNGKTDGVGAPLGLHDLVFGPHGGRIFSCAADREQAKLVFSTAKRMVDLDRDLSGLLKTYRDVIEFPTTGSTYRALSAEAFTKEGLDPSLVIFDEVHAQPTRELWDTMALAFGARIDPLMVGITTAGVMVDRTGQPSLCYTLYEYGCKIIAGEIDDPSFFMAWWQAERGADHTAEPTWRAANPGYGDIVSAEDFESAVRRTPEAEYRTKRCNQWVATSEMWLPHGAWAACEDRGRVVPAGTTVVLSFDGSKTGDSTALVGVTVEEKPHVFVLGSWERPPNVLEWRVPRGEVKQVVRDQCRGLNVLEVAWDDWMWQDAREELEDDGLPIEVFPQTADRMGKATQRFFEAVVDHGLTQDGNPALARHLDNAVLKPTPSGKARIVKASPNSKAWIDLAVTAVMGVDRADWWFLNTASAVVPPRRAERSRESDLMTQQW